MTIHKVAVYGTLREGGKNHRLVSACRFLERLKITGKLLDVGGFPALVRARFPAEPTVEAELYECTDQQLLALDYLEGYEERRPDLSLYLREKWGGRGHPHGEFWVYVWNGRQDLPVIESGDWIEHVKNKPSLY